MIKNRIKKPVLVRFATFGGASVLASRLVSSLAPPKRTTTKKPDALTLTPATATLWYDE